MKVLWFEISTPSQYKQAGRVVLGWQDSLENIVRESKEVDLYIAFESQTDKEVKVIDGVTYIPMYIEYSFWDRKKSQFTWMVNARKIISKGIEVINEYAPDIIHVFGNEWPFGLLAKYTQIPLVIHIQGSIIPYNNALYPPKYNEFTFAVAIGLNLRKQWHFVKSYYKDRSREQMEREIWKLVSHYMGRTNWDKALVGIFHPHATYHHVEEALRPIFLKSCKTWRLPSDSKIRLFSTGCSNFWKGVDVMLKTAHILKQMGVDFEWKVAGKMSYNIREVVEKKENLRFEDNNIEILGFTNPDDLVDYLSKSTLYVHTAYIENSPNSICEAQIIGIPIISTMVGGISSLIHNDQDGILLPANDPWQFADAIVNLSKDRNKMLEYSNKAYETAIKRHNPVRILNELLKCYHDVINRRGGK